MVVQTVDLDPTQGGHGTPPVPISAGWLPIDTAPLDGTEVWAGTPTRGPVMIVMYPVRSRYIDGRWCAKFGGGWASYDPQPSVWMALDK